MSSASFRQAPKAGGGAVHEPHDAASRLGEPLRGQPIGVPRAGQHPGECGRLVRPRHQHADLAGREEDGERQCQPAGRKPGDVVSHDPSIAHVEGHRVGEE